MRLHPRDIKRMMFSCVQCGQCLQACEQSQAAVQKPPILSWKVDAAAVAETIRQRRSAMAQPSQEMPPSSIAHKDEAH
ncbi:MAG: hypothetical protein IT506_05000 [Aquabacterium sp.]|jgi:polyferredoxin|nr:hypothetical protein [Aquabacterium sp.]